MRFVAKKSAGLLESDMDLETYQKQMAALGINRGGFEPDAEFHHFNAVTDGKEPVYIDSKASTKQVKAPMQPVAQHLQCQHPHLKNAGKWWSELSPKERKKASAQRSRNGKAQVR